MELKAPSDIKRDFGRRLTELREALDHRSGKAFADALGIDQNTYTMWERGDRLPSVQNMRMIKAKTGITIDYLLFGDITTLPVHLYKLLAPASSRRA